MHNQEEDTMKHRVKNQFNSTIQLFMSEVSLLVVYATFHIVGNIIALLQFIAGGRSSTWKKPSTFDIFSLYFLYSGRLKTLKMVNKNLCFIEEGMNTFVWFVLGLTNIYLLNLLTYLNNVLYLLVNCYFIIRYKLITVCLIA